MIAAHPAPVRLAVRAARPPDETRACGQHDSIGSSASLGDELPRRGTRHRGHAYLRGDTVAVVGDGPPAVALVITYVADLLDGARGQTGQPATNIKTGGSAVGHIPGRRVGGINGTVWAGRPGHGVHCKHIVDRATQLIDRGQVEIGELGEGLDSNTEQAR